MTDQPLFKKVDELESAYAPQELNEGNQRRAAAELEDGGRETDSTDVDVGVPAAGAGLLGQMGSGASSSITGGAPGAIGPGVASSADEDQTTGDRPI